MNIKYIKNSYNARGVKSSIYVLFRYFSNVSLNENISLNI